MSRSLSGLVLAGLVLSSAVGAAENRTIQYIGKDFNDPFEDKGVFAGKTADDKTPQQDMQARLSGLVVEGILLSPRESLAIINRKVVRVGDLISGFKVRAIEVDGVVLVTEPPAPVKSYKLTHKGKRP